jgi:predicted Zn-dependent protease
MRSKEKADELYNNSLKLHGQEKAKQEALNSAHAAKALAPMDRWDYWGRVVNHIISR